MTLVVGFAPGRARARRPAPRRACSRRSAGDDLVVCAVIPAPWPPSPARVDAEYRAELEQPGATRRSTRRARGCPTTCRRASSSITRARLRPGCSRWPSEHDAGIVIAPGEPLGQSPRQLRGCCTRSPFPVALAPRGFRCPARRAA